MFHITVEKNIHLMFPHMNLNQQFKLARKSLHFPLFFLIKRQLLIITFDIQLVDYSTFSK